LLSVCMQMHLRLRSRNSWRLLLLLLLKLNLLLLLALLLFSLLSLIDLQLVLLLLQCQLKLCLFLPLPLRSLLQLLKLQRVDGRTLPRRRTGNAHTIRRSSMSGSDLHWRCIILSTSQLQRAVLLLVLLLMGSHARSDLHGGTLTILISCPGVHGTLPLLPVSSYARSDLHGRCLVIVLLSCLRCTLHGILL